MTAYIHEYPHVRSYRLSGVHLVKTLVPAHLRYYVIIGIALRVHHDHVDAIVYGPCEVNGIPDGRLVLTRKGGLELEELI